MRNQRNVEDQLDLGPDKDSVDKEKCAPYLNQEFGYAARVSPGKYFAIWGCHQMSESECNRGLWVLGWNENQPNSSVINARQMIAEALSDMNLTNETGIWENMVINENVFAGDTEKEVCRKERFLNNCTWETLTKPVNVNKQTNLMIFILICAILLLIAAVAAVMCIWNTI